MSTVLIVEDEKALHDAYKLILEKEKYKVLSAFDGKEALTLLKEHKPDLILLDLRMPKMGGLDFLRQFEDRSPQTKIIVFSNLDTQTEIDTAYDLGADRYILKAWASPQELIKVVKDALAK